MADETKPAKAKKRNIFTYEYNGATVCVDPLRIDLKLYEALAGEDDQSLWQQAFPPKPEAGLVDSKGAAALFNDVIWPARAKFVEATRKAFGVVELQPSGEGLSDMEILDLYLAFDEWRANVGKDTASQPSDTPSTEGSTGEGSPTSPSVV